LKDEPPKDSVLILLTYINLKTYNYHADDEYHYFKFKVQVFN